MRTASLGRSKKINGIHWIITLADRKEYINDDFDNFLDRLNLETGARLQWYQQDGAPPHNYLSLREHLDITFPNSWIGRNGPIAWPPRSPDLSVLDFFYGEL